MAPATRIDAIHHCVHRACSLALAEQVPAPRQLELVSAKLAEAS